MKLTDLVLWFADRSSGAKPVSQIRAKCGDVRHELRHLEQLGILYSYVNHKANVRFYTLRDHALYRMRRAA